MAEGARERILKKAAELFYTQGVHNTGINQIIDESRVAKASFYHHFPSKDDLICECMIAFRDIISRRVKKVIDSSDNFTDFLNRWAASIEKDVSRENFNGCPIANTGMITNMSSGKFREQFNHILDSWYDLLSDYFEKCKKRGELPDETDTRMLSRRLLHLYEGALTMWILSGDSRYVKDLRDLFPAMITLSVKEKT
jgi:AcrR family transcriptional regulator